MSASKHIDKVCLTVTALMLALTVLFMSGGLPFITAATGTPKYETTLFDTSYVHRIDLVADDWDAFIENCESEEYSPVTAVIDGNRHENVALRAKGNTSLSQVREQGGVRYSFKLEFDHYEKGKTCDGLDKLCLNNLIQDNTMMKDYIAYRLMDSFGVYAPLCSYAYLTVNGEDFGLYLAVEGVEDSFLSRCFGSDAGELYKPDSMDLGGGRGNGKDFAMGELPFGEGEDRDGGRPSMPSEIPEGMQGEMPEGMPEGAPDGAERGKGSDAVKLRYIDDDPASYADIFDNAKTEVTTADEERLIASLKRLSAYTELEDTLDTDEVLRYFVVHNFVCNGDSYTGSMIHNYYLYEKDGRLAMIPWDYNLAFGTFQAGSADAAVSASVDDPLSGGDTDERPMLGWIFSDETYTERYHELFSDFTKRWFADGELASLIEETAELICPYVAKDPTKFCTAEEFETGVTALTRFVTLRAESVSRQLKGLDAAVDTAGLNLADMGTMEKGGFGGEGESGGRRPDAGEKNFLPLAKGGKRATMRKNGGEDTP